MFFLHVRLLVRLDFLVFVERARAKEGERGAAHVPPSAACYGYPPSLCCVPRFVYLLSAVWYLR